ncbi:(2Fe-2S)-binding protein [Rhizobium sp. Root482]|uniref:(2Fe-2S)-binding protein n=1 Tax=Rhizobium sp. Root482 TaxID=1736543 RepID=UPI0006FEF585|nr:(2Fe-2S)-binding protein [Rhizobium sp. Root482]KQY26929.1 oxidase [Rhizobium sp. Root482]
MNERDVIVIGGGPAGMAAAIEAALAGLSVDLVEQRPTLGGAIYRQQADGGTSPVQSKMARQRFARLSTALAGISANMRFSSVFLGLDADGFVLIENRQIGRIELIRSRAIIVATGAVERILPRPGSELPGVSTAGGLQVMLKETSRAPQGRVLLAGNGPLLLAVAAQLIRLGNPPAGIVEAGDPLRAAALSNVGLLSHPALLAEAAVYLKDIYRAGTPWFRGTRLTRIEKVDGALQATLCDRHDAVRTILVDRIGLHDGIQSNRIGLPAEQTRTGSAPVVVRAGDCREALGAVAAEADGRRAGLLAVSLLSGIATDISVAERAIARQRQAQALITRSFMPVAGGSHLASLPDETLLCRCEGRTVGDLRQLLDRPDPISDREIKHNGRFAMGLCQGRFCASNVAELVALLRPDASKPTPDGLTGQRWPIRPVSIGALTRAAPEDNCED